MNIDKNIPDLPHSKYAGTDSTPTLTFQAPCRVTSFELALSITVYGAEFPKSVLENWENVVRGTWELPRLHMERLEDPGCMLVASVELFDSLPFNSLYKMGRHVHIIDKFGSSTVHRNIFPTSLVRLFASYLATQTTRAIPAMQTKAPIRNTMERSSFFRVEVWTFHTMVWGKARIAISRHVLIIPVDR